MSNFSYKDAKGKLVQVPVRYGDMNRQVAQILNKNSENVIPSVPFISCFIDSLNFDRSRLQDPTFVSTMNIREMAYDENGNQYINQQGSNYTVERIMPSPHEVTFHADIWTSNTDQKLQIWEQIAVLFNPSMELQTTDNYIDWTSLSVLTLEQQIWTNRTIPQGVEQDIDILKMVFKAPIWITPPAKVKKLGVITKIINDVHSISAGILSDNYAHVGALINFGDSAARVILTPGNYSLLITDNSAVLVNANSKGDSLDTTDPENIASWYKILDFHPGKFTAGLSQIRLSKPGGGEVVAYVGVDPLDDTRMMLNIDQETIPSNTTIAGRTTVDAIINPETYNPKGVAGGARFLILEDINKNADLPDYSGPLAWKNLDGTDFRANANDIIQWSGTAWSVVFNSAETTEVVYITNSYTGVQYKWENSSWSKSYEGLYDRGTWRLVL
jgi:hypothetical protein